MNGNSGVTNRFAGVVSAGSSYRRSDASVDVAALPEDDVSSPSSAVLTQARWGYRKTDASRGEQVLGHIRLLMAPVHRFKLLVVSEKRQNRGMVGDDGLAYLTGLSGEDRRP